MKADCHEVKIIEDFSDLDANSVSDDIVENTQDTMTILSKYVEDLDTTLDKPRLINIQRQLYKEAQDLEIWLSLNMWDGRTFYLLEINLLKFNLIKIQQH